RRGELDRQRNRQAGEDRRTQSVHGERQREGEQLRQLGRGTGRNARRLGGHLGNASERHALRALRVILLAFFIVVCLGLLEVQQTDRLFAQAIDGFAAERRGRN